MMSVTSLVLVLLAAGLASLCVNALIVWGAARLLRSPTVTFPRALALVVLNAVVMSLVLLWPCLAPASLRQSPFSTLVPVLLVFGVQLALMRVFLGLPGGKLLTLAVIWNPLSAVCAVALLVLLYFTVAEGFIVPTGGMATAILGYHKDAVCPKCGLSFAVNCSQEVVAPDGESVVITGCTCPNCRSHIDLGREAKPLVGDRILVSKSLFRPVGAAPGRFDLVAFVYPVRAGQKGEQIRYVRRVVGLPGETVAIASGRLYALPPDKGPRFDDGAVPERDRWQYPYMHVDDPQALERWDKQEFRPLHKPPEVVLALRRLVYDNDHPAQDLKDSPRWQKDRVWAEDAVAHTFRYAPGKVAGPDWLHYRHVIARNGRAKPELITDFIGYNNFEPAAGPETPHWVGDLMLECDVTIDRPDGQLALELSRGIDRFRAVFDLPTGDCTLRQLKKNKEEAPALDDGEELATKPTAMKKAGTYHVRFANVDDRLLLWVNDDLPLGGEGASYTPAEDGGPTPENDLWPASIGATGAGVTIGKLQLWRDTYYTAMREGGPDDYPPLDPADPTTWEPLRHLTPLTFYVQPGHYLCLGDNSPHSSDSRAWGLVPERLIDGRALMIYYPFDRAGRLH
jgi:signal peptidase I